jgi:AcrR family transcriptional regulator
MHKTDEAIKPNRVRRDRRAEIIEEATRLFGEYGFQGATLSAVAEAVGLTEPGVLHYFPSKVHLLQGVLDHRDQQDLGKYMELAGPEQKNLADFFGLLEDLQTQNEKIPGLIQLYTVLVSESIRSDHPSHDYFVDRFRRGRQIYVNQFLELDNTEIRPDVDFEELASLIMAVMDGLQMQWLLDPGKVNMAASFKLFSKIVVAYLKG